ncbi:MAG: hypothetical protein K5925_02045 [Bacilli bacterium]|nr:hypothetical protein [Bacilli bacterium]
MRKTTLAVLAVSTLATLGLAVAYLVKTEPDVSVSRTYANPEYGCALPDSTYMEIGDLCALSSGTTNPKTIRGTVTRSTSDMTYIQRVNQQTHRLDAISVYNLGRSYTPGNVLDISGGTLMKTNGVPSLNATGAEVDVAYSVNTTGYDPTLYDSVGDFVSHSHDNTYAYSHYVELHNAKVEYEVGSDTVFTLSDISNSSIRMAGEATTDDIKTALDDYYLRGSNLSIKGVLYKNGDTDVLRIVDENDIDIYDSPLRWGQDTTILQAWNWSISNIDAQLDNIKNAGFKTIQVSPLQPQKDKDSDDTWQQGWWKLYQPYAFKVSDSSNETTIGTKDDLTDLCAHAKERGINIIVDVVANHLAGGTGTSFHSRVVDYDSELANTANVIHTYGPMNDSQQGTVQGHFVGYPDLNTSLSIVQERVIDMLEDYIDCGVRGFRFDAAKHIETPSDGEYASDFWSNVTTSIDTYSQSTKGYTTYKYGEILGAGNDRWPSWYNDYMSSSSAETRKYINGVQAGSVDGIDGGYGYDMPADKSVLWPESHDDFKAEFEAGTTKDQFNINKAYAMQASRAGAATLYLARPTDGNTKMGQIGSMAFSTDAVVRASNIFHNELYNATEYLRRENGYYINIRKGSERYGAMIVNVGGSGSGSINLNTYNANSIPDGEYYDLANNRTVTVAGGYVQANFGDTAVMALLRVEKSGTEITSGYGLKINSRPILAVDQGTQDYQGRQQYKIIRQHFDEGDEFTLYDFSNKATWTIDVDGYSFGGGSDDDTTWQSYFSKTNTKYTVLQDFDADVYIKIKNQDDKIYFDLQGLSVSKSSTSLLPGGTDTITVSHYAGSYTATSRNTNVATVAKAGDTITITAVAAGSTVIDVTDGVAPKEIEVTVDPYLNLYKMHLNSSDHNLTGKNENTEYYITEVELAVNDELCFYLGSSANCYGYADIKPSSPAKANFVNSGGKIRVSTAGTYDFYVKVEADESGTDEGKRIYIMETPAEPEPEPSTKTIPLSLGAWGNGADTYAWVWGAGVSSQWVKAVNNQLVVPEGVTGLKLVRMESDTDPSFDTNWNETGDLTYQASKTLTFTSWGSGKLANFNWQ